MSIYQHCVLTGQQQLRMSSMTQSHVGNISSDNTRVLFLHLRHKKSAIFHDTPQYFANGKCNALENYIKSRLHFEQ